MSHYTDIGFKINSNKDVIDIFNQIISNKNYPQQVWSVSSTEKDNIVLTMQNVGNICYFAKLDNKKKSILEIGLSHNNENISKMEIVDVNYNNKNGFPIVQLEKDGIPFWFECPNVELYDMKAETECDVKIASFANNVKIKKSQDKIENSEDGEFQFADESYMSSMMFQGDPATAFVSGIIKSYMKEKNVITNMDYYAIDVECLGLNIKMLVDISLLDEREIVSGNVIFGEFWNTVILVGDKHPYCF